MIKQWGTVTGYPSNTTTKDFYVAFTSPSSWVGNAININSWGSSAYAKILPTTSGASYYPITISYSEKMFWIAVGY